MRVLNCPVCRSPRVHRSRHRTLFERLRQHFTDKLPVRCHHCGWRAWVEGWNPTAVLPPKPLPVIPPISARELDGLDPMNEPLR